MVTQISANSAKKYECDICNVICSKKNDYERHVLTNKHIGNVQGNKNSAIKDYTCELCKKVYKSRKGLWGHSKTCVVEEIHLTPNPESLKILTNLVLEVVKNNSELLKQNQDFQKQILEVCKNNNTTNNINNHSNNKTFNLNFFLNEQCKDAMNIMDFVNTFQLQFSDLEKIGDVGYVEGISNIIIDKLNQMDIYKRPIHCSDAKREIMHIKDNDVWEKDNENYDKLRLAIKHITKKNTDMINPWAEKHPGVRDSDHRLNDKYQEIIIEAMGGKNNKTMREGESKIIKKISKMVLINKNL